jgi:transposase InsO family protein
MDRLLFDNGSQYINKHLLRAADRLGITVIHAKPYHAWTKGYDKKSVMLRNAC